MKGLIIKQPWIDKILSGDKTWEIRSSNTKHRGTIGLIQSGTGNIIGTAELVATRRLAKIEMYLHYNHHQIPNYDEINYTHIWAWEMANAKRYEDPIPYTHPQGAVIWVNLKEVES
jgi:hypothetical protein